MFPVLPLAVCRRWDRAVEPYAVTVSRMRLRTHTTHVTSCPNKIQRLTITRWIIFCACTEFHDQPITIKFTFVNPPKFRNLRLVGQRRRRCCWWSCIALFTYSIWICYFFSLFFAYFFPFFVVWFGKFILQLLFNFDFCEFNQFKWIRTQCAQYFVEFSVESHFHVTTPFCLFFALFVPFALHLPHPLASLLFLSDVEI